ncbi:MAG: tetratricopeptide repeat protein [Balneolaceae bacterium]
MLKNRLNAFLLMLLCGAMGGICPTVVQAQSYEVEQANRAFSQQNYSEAINWSQQALSRDSLNSLAYQVLAASNLALMKFAETEKVANRGLKHLPNSNALIWFKSESLLQRGMLQEALPGYQKLLTANSHISTQDIRLRLGLIYQSLGGQFYQQEKFELAEENLQNSKTYIPDSVASYSNLALVYMRQNKWEEALEVIDEGREIFPESEGLLKMRVNALYETRNYGDVLDEYEQLYQRNPEDLDNAITYAELLLAQGKREQSEKIYEKLLDKHPNELKIYESLIGFYKARNNTLAQRGALRKMYTQFPKEASTMQRIAETYTAEKEWDNARAAYDSAATFGGDLKDIAVLKADTYLQQDSLEAAHEIYEQALQQFPKYPHLLRLKGDSEEILGAFDQAITTYKAFVEVEKSPEAYERLGRVYLLTGDNEKALDNFEQAAKKNTKSAVAYYEIARLYLHTNRKNEAFEMSLWALKLALTNLNVLQESLVSSLQQQNNLLEMKETDNMAGRFSENNFIAIEVFDFFTTHFEKEKVMPELHSLKNEYPQSGRLFYMISSYYIENGNKDEGVDLLKESVTLSPNLADAHVALGGYYSEQGQEQQANISYERALSADPENATAYRKIIELHREKGTLDQLCDRWITQLRVKPNQPILKEFLIEALHKAGRFEEASEIIQSGRKKAS